MTIEPSLNILRRTIPIPVHHLKIKLTDFFGVKSLQCRLLQSLWLIWIMFGMNGYKILKCFRKGQRVSGDLPCPATGLIGYTADILIRLPYSKALIRQCRFTGWSVSLWFTLTYITISHHAIHIGLHAPTPNVRVTQYYMYSCFFWLCLTEHIGLSPGGDLGEKVPLSWLTSPYFELREKFKCIEHIWKSKILIKTLKILKMSQNFSLSKSSRLTPAHSVQDKLDSLFSKMIFSLYFITIHAHKYCSLRWYVEFLVHPEVIANKIGFGGQSP